LQCGWSKDGLQTFNKLAREIYIDRKEHGEAFDSAFKKNMEQQMESTNKNGKRKRNCIDTYNDLNQGHLITNNEEEGGDKEEEWVAKNMFKV